MPGVKETVKEALIHEVDNVRSLSENALRSGAYLYPIKGLLYYLPRRSLWTPLLSQIISMLTLSIGVLVFMFTFTYLPQVAVLSAVSGPFAVLAAGVLVIGESSVIAGVLGRVCLMEEGVVDTFDAVLVENGMMDLVAEGRQINAGSRDAIGKLGKLVKRPFVKFSPSSIIRYLVYLSLNAIPLVGPVIFLVLQGKRAGPAYHDRYFQLKGWSSSRSEEWVEKRRSDYTSFGITTTLLEFVPLASIFFAFTNAAGAALWVVDIERGNGTAPALREQAKKAE